MDQKRLTELGLDEATAKKIAEEIEKEQEHKDFIPKHRFDEVSEKLKTADKKTATLEEQIKERDTQLETLRKNSDSETLKKQIEALQTENTETKKKLNDAEQAHAAELRTTRRTAIDDRLLNGAKAKNLAAAKALLKTIGEDIDEEKYTTERENEIKELLGKEDSKFMFGSDDSSEGLRARKPGTSGGDPPGALTAGALAAQRINQEKFPDKKE